jgi:hypothetical protein
MEDQLMEDQLKAARKAGREEGRKEILVDLVELVEVYRDYERQPMAVFIGLVRFIKNNTIEGEEGKS